jgi:hypothetical protein
VDLRHQPLADRPAHRALPAADVLPDRLLRDIRALLIDEPLMDPLGGMPLLARSVPISLKPRVDHRPIRPQLRRRRPTGDRLTGGTGDASACLTVRR